jgi:Domain of unknown function (DUF4173)
MMLTEAMHRVRGPANSPVAWLKLRLAAAVFSAGFSDWLILGHDMGISLVLALVIVGIVATALNPIRASTRNQSIAVTALMAGILPLVEEVNWLSFFFALLGLTISSAILISQNRDEWGTRLRRLCLALLFPFCRPVADCLRVLKLFKRRHRPKPKSSTWHTWVLPIGCSLIFFLLFADANPLIADFLGRIDFTSAHHTITPARVLFWLLIASFVWPLLHPPTLRRRVCKSGQTPSIQPLLSPVLFSASAILYSLVPFNALFALENILDLGYLWVGITLPQNMTFAEYAHRGAYPLIITAMLAAAFVLVATRRGRAGESSRPIRLLIIAWTVQNLILVVSAIRRLDLYVATYSLTYLRVAALIWMVLVAFGLITILIRILRQKTTSWLITANAVALGATLYLSCFVDTPALIARYNLGHSREIIGQGAALDWCYFQYLGPSVIPVLDQKHALLWEATSEKMFQTQRHALVRQADARDQNWRAWTLSSWRLHRYLANTDADTQDQPPGRF